MVPNTHNEHVTFIGPRSHKHKRTYTHGYKCRKAGRVEVSAVSSSPLLPYHSSVDPCSRHPLSSSALRLVGVDNSNDMNLITSSLSSSLSSPSSDVLSSEDIVIGTILAFALAFLFSFLQGRTPSSSNIKLWPEDDDSSNGRRSRQKTGEKDQDGYGVELETEKGKEDLVGFSSQSESMLTEGEIDGNDNDDNGRKSRGVVVFDGDDWREVSKPENYIMYRTKLRKDIADLNYTNDNSNANANANLDNITNINTSTKSSRPTWKKENRLVLIALLILFVPIFSIEFFFALSRQFICGDFVTQVDDSLWLTDSDRAISATNGLSPWARQLCSPHTE